MKKHFGAIEGIWRKAVGASGPGLLLLSSLGSACGIALAQTGPAVSAPAQPMTSVILAQPPAPAFGQISGTVLDAGAAIVSGADVTLTLDGGGQSRRTTTDLEGRFHFENVPPGRFTVKAMMKGMKPGSYTGSLLAKESLEVPALRLDLATVDTSVDVTVSQQDLAEAEIHVEEHQRLGGVVPNFFVSYDWRAPPLTARQKFELAWKNTIDPANSAINLGIAGIQQGTNSISGYHQGAAGYGKRYGADEANLAVGTMLGGAVFPVIFRQDPRYFYKGTGSIWSRSLYALSTAVIQRGDNGKWQPAYAGILGDLSAGAAANLYYPAANRTGAALTFENGLIDVGYDALGNLVQEFVFKHLTPHAPNYQNYGTRTP
jgi:hypothetical protein